MYSHMPPSVNGEGLAPDTRINEFGKLPWFDWWYALTAPAKPDESASFKKREIYRRALFISILLCLVLTLMLFAMLVSILARNVPNTIVTFVVIALLVIALLLNRMGLLIIEGFIVVGLWSVGEMLTFLVLPQLDISNVMQYDLLIVAILLAVAFFPAWSVFLVGLFNCIFIWLSLTYLKQTPALVQLIHHDGLGRMLTRPVSLTLVVMIVTYLWSRSNHHALQRADRAEMINKLQSELNESDKAMMLQKNLINHSIQNISDVLAAYSNGNATIRVPMTQNNALWNISGPINTLLGRAQRLRQAEAELEHMRPLFQHLESENATLRATLQKQQAGSPPQMTPSQRKGNYVPDARTSRPNPPTNDVNGR